MFFNLTAFGKIKLHLKQPFTTTSSGYGRVMQARYYVVDGVAGGFQNNSPTLVNSAYGCAMKKEKAAHSSKY